MNVQELIEVLGAQDPKAPVYMYDPEWDALIPVRSITTKDPRADKAERIHKHSVYLSSDPE